MMFFSLVSTQARRVRVGFFLGVVLLGLAGCKDEGYPAHLSYPLRSDPLITATPTAEPKNIDRPGELSQILNIYLDPAERGKSTYDPNNLKADQRGVIEDTLHAVFGTPAKPTLQEIADETRKALALDDATLQEGSRLYRQHCLHCHGLTGDGRGPTAAWVNPHPRDFRRGQFKFTSSSANLGVRRARRDDLLRVFREGIEGASMPSFRLLPDHELEALASYIIHLSLRGQVEGYAIDMLRLEQFGTDKVEGEMKEITRDFAQFWVATERSPIKPTPYVPLTRESVVRGMNLFLIKDKPGEAAAGCISCHVDFGRAATFRFDDWGTINRPADVARGSYRGGRRPIDLYYRVHSGISGVGMPATSLVTKPGQPDPIWDVVNFLLVLPYADKHEQYGVNIDTTVAAGKGR